VAQPAYVSVKWPPTGLTRLPPKGVDSIENATQVDRVLGDLIRAEIVRCKLQIRVHSYSADAPVFSQGARADAIYLVEEGVVKVTRGEADGSFLVLGLRKRGHPGLAVCPAETGLYDRRPCADPLRHARRSRLRHHCSNPREQGLGMASSSISEPESVRTTRKDRVVWSAFSPGSADPFLGRTRLVSGPQWLEVKMPATLKFWEIAQVIGVTPPYLTRLFNELERDGLLRR
jgi:CRP-like cAMP-binding protein